MKGFFAGLVLKLLLWQSLTTLDASTRFSRDVLTFPIRHFGRCQFHHNIWGFCQNLDDCNSFLASHKNDKTFIAKHKCDSTYNQRLVCCPNEPFDLRGSSSEISLPVPTQCGLMLMDKIFNGNKAGPHDYPWMVLIETTTDLGDKEFVCSGSLINDRWVLTASHCHNEASKKITAVRLGEWNRATDKDCIINQNNIEECLPPHIDVKVDEVVQHNLYRRFKNENDIALVRMSRSISTTEYIKPICLPVETSMRTDMYEYSEAYIAGWGSTGNTNKMSNWKLEANLTIWTRDQCEHSLATFGGQTNKFDDRILCAGSATGQSSCVGDSGGALMVVRPPYFAVGVISSGLPSCNGTAPIVFTRVGPFMDWIHDTINGYY